MRLPYEAQVGNVYVASETAEGLRIAVDKVMRGEPMLCARMRVKGSDVEGDVIAVDTEKRTARIQWRQPTLGGRAIVKRERTVAFSKLEWA